MDVVDSEEEKIEDQTMSWPQTIPADLRPRLAEVLSFRNCGPAEVWGAVRDWLEANGVEMPEGIKAEQSEGTAQRDQRNSGRALERQMKVVTPNGHSRRSRRTSPRGIVASMRTWKPRIW